MFLSPVRKKFVLHWGEMGTRWGVNRTVAQVHALLYVSERPLDAETIASTLSVARSNVSTSLRELQGWGVVKVVHVLGDRRDHFESMRDVWEMFRVVLDERKRREIDPTEAVLRQCLAEATPADDARTEERLREMLEFFEVMSAWYAGVRRLPHPVLMKMLKMGDKVARFLSPTK